MEYIFLEETARRRQHIARRRRAYGNYCRVGPYPAVIKISYASVSLI